MRFTRIILSTVMAMSLVAAARAGPVQTFTDIDAFLEAAGEVREIDFETLPDGTPSYMFAEITPEFNYTGQGVEFFAHVPPLWIHGCEEGGFRLCACPQDSQGPLNWIIAELVEPASAVGIAFRGGTTLTIGDADGSAQLETWTWAGGGELFLGVISDIPIGRAYVGGFAGVPPGSDVEMIESFFFTPVPEPVSLVLLASGVLIVLGRRSP
ncbi:MAG: hypothetical protein WBE26_07485 [Phycisphaerae bacterium]